MPRPAPDIEVIFSEAAALLREEGEQGLSMRALASRVGCSPMSLYTHIGKRQDLVDGMILRFFRSILLEVPDTGSWQSRVFLWACSLREAYLAFPGIVPLIRPDTRWVVETTISRQLYRILLSAGFSEAHAIALCRTLMWQVTALSMLEVRSEGVEHDVDIRSGRLVPEGEGTALHRMLAGHHTLEMTGPIFSYLLGLIIDGVARERRTGKRPSVLDSL